MATKTFYFQNVRVDGWETFDESAVAAATSGTGWTVGTTAGDSMQSELQAATKRADTTFTHATAPDGSLDTSLKDAIRTTNPITGAFANASWTFSFAVRSTVAASQQGRMRVRVLIADADGSNAIDVTAGGAHLTLSQVSVPSGSDGVSTISIAMPRFFVNNRYLFFQIAWRREVAGSNVNADVLLRTGSSGPVGTRVVTSNFVPYASETTLTFPYDQTFTAATFNATAAKWYTYTAPAGSFALGMNAFTTTNPTSSGNLLRVSVFDMTTALSPFGINSAFGGWQKMNGGREYKILVERSTSGATVTNDPRILFDRAEFLTSVPAGGYLINDDTTVNGESPAAIVYDASGNFLGFLDGIPSNEQGTSLPNGVMLQHDRYGDHGDAGSLALFDANGGLIAANLKPGGQTIPVNGLLIAASDDDFFVADIFEVDLQAKIYRVTTAGAMSLVATLAEDDLSAMGVSRDGTVLYWTRFFDGSTSGDTTSVRRHDLVNDVALSDLYLISGLLNGSIARTAVNENNGEIMVLTDGSIVTWYRDYDTSLDHLIHISAAGALLHDYTYNYTTTLEINHLAPSPTAGKVRIWYYIGGSSGSQGRIGDIDLSTGTLSPSLDVEHFSAGGNLVRASAVLFGPSNSCVIVTAGGFGEEEEPEPDDVIGTTPSPNCCDERTPGGVDPSDEPDIEEDITTGFGPCAGSGIVPWVANPANGSDVW